jgi:uncharacterized metal-binding protein YceD (DUF177 family)
MKKFKEYIIPFAGLKQGNHQFKYKIDNSFFEAFNYTEFNQTNINVEVQLVKSSTMLELTFTSAGQVNVNCDVSNEPFNLEANGSLELVVKFGEEYNDENDEILIIPHGEHQINIAQYIYEMIVLSVPAKRVHPGIEDGTLSSDILAKLEELELKDSEEETKEETDPRWDALKKLLTDK